MNSNSLKFSCFVLYLILLTHNLHFSTASSAIFMLDYICTKLRLHMTLLDTGYDPSLLKDISYILLTRTFVQPTDN